MHTLNDGMTLFLCFLALTFGQLAAIVMTVGISKNTNPKEKVKSFFKDLRGKK